MVMVRPRCDYGCPFQNPPPVTRISLVCMRGWFDGFPRKVGGADETAAAELLECIRLD